MSVSKPHELSGARTLSSTDSFIGEITKEPRESRTLIICIDRDNDIGERTGVRTPIIGKDACLAAATKLALADPEEADANAIFAAIKEFDGLLRKGFNCEVILVSGLFDRGVLGDRKIRREVAEALKGFPADGAVIVSDGVEGEELIPILQSLVPIISLRRVIIKHSASVEESYQVLGRYLKMLFFDSRYARYSLGIPGLIFIGAVLISLVQPRAAPLVITVVIGLIFVIRGFDIDRRVESLGSLSAAGYLRLFATLASVLIILGGIAAGILVFFATTVPPCISPAGQIRSCDIPARVASNSSAIVGYAPQIIGYFLQGSQLYVWIGLGVYVMTTIFFNILRPRPRHVLRYVVALIVLGLLFVPVQLFASVLLQEVTANILIGIVLLALAASFAVAAYVYSYLSKRRRPTQLVETESAESTPNV